MTVPLGVELRCSVNRGPFWVKSGKAHGEQMLSGLPPITDIALENWRPPGHHCCPGQRPLTNWKSDGHAAVNLSICISSCSYGGGEFAIHSPTDWAVAISS